MATLLGSELPSEAMVLFGARRAEDVAGRALVMVTVDDAGGPHPGIASFAEIFAVDPKHLRVALWTNTSAARNLRARPRFALCMIDRGGAYYVKGEATDLGSDHADLKGQNVFWVTITEVYEDREPAFEMAGLTFSATDSKMTQWWGQLFEAVRKSSAAPR